MIKELFIEIWSYKIFYLKVNKTIQLKLYNKIIDFGIAGTNLAKNESSDAGSLSYMAP